MARVSVESEVLTAGAYVGIGSNRGGIFDTFLRPELILLILFMIYLHLLESYRRTALLKCWNGAQPAFAITFTGSNSLGKRN